MLPSCHSVLSQTHVGARALHVISTNISIACPPTAPPGGVQFSTGYPLEKKI
jgi:hypothetical protein